MSHSSKSQCDERLRHAHPEPTPPLASADDRLLDHHIEEVLGAIRDLDRLRVDPDVY